MKILKEGTFDADLSAIWNCYKCGALIESSKAEGTLTKEDSPMETIYHVVTVCPQCGSENRILANRFHAKPRFTLEDRRSQKNEA